MARKTKTEDKKAETAAAETATKKRKSRKKEWKPGDITKAGCEVVKVTEDKMGVHGHTTVLTIKCLETGKPFDIYTQDAHQTKYHPEVRARMKREKNANKKAEKSVESKAPVAKAPAKTKAPAKSKAKAKAKAA